MSTKDADWRTASVDSKSLIGEDPINGAMNPLEDENAQFGIEQIENQYDDLRKRKRDIDRDLESHRDHFRTKLDNLHAQREQAMLIASKHAGNIGLVYQAKENTFYRVIIVDTPPPKALDELDQSYLKFAANLVHGECRTDSEAEPTSETRNENSEPPEPETSIEKPAVSLAAENGATIEPAPGSPVLPVKPTYPEKPTRPKMSEVKDSSEVRKKWERSANWKAGTAWFASLLVGAFIGYGLLNITGLPFRKPGNELLLPGGLALGIAAVIGIKLILDILWFNFGRDRELAKTTVWQTALTALTTLMFVAAEATLGGFAINKYSKNVGFGPDSETPLWIAIMVAGAVSSATLLFSAALGYQKGIRSVGAQEFELEEYKLSLREYDRDVERLNREYEDALQEYSKEVERRNAMVFEQEAVRAELEKARISQFIELEAKLHQMKKDALDNAKSEHQKATQKRDAHSENLDANFESASLERAARTAEFESYKKLPDFLALCQCIGLIDSINLRIGEVEKEFTNESISKGHGKKIQLF